jgi:hypothetical protein
MAVARPIPDDGPVIMTVFIAMTVTSVSIRD